MKVLDSEFTNLSYLDAGDIRFPIPDYSQDDLLQFEELPFPGIVDSQVVKNGSKYLVPLGEEFENDDASWIMACTFLVFTMQTGLGLIESGFCSMKNEVKHILRLYLPMLYLALAMLYPYSTYVLAMLYPYSTYVLAMLFLCSTYALPMLYLCSTYALPMLYLCSTYVIAMLFLCSTYALPTLYQCSTHVLTMLYLWFQDHLKIYLWFQDHRFLWWLIVGSLNRSFNI